ncbi:MAG: hypothetical protein L0H73_00235 [Nitrococcus sp.]|nr:hypothetical protein [Nitrococcus sp.]
MQVEEPYPRESGGAAAHGFRVEIGLGPCTPMHSYFGIQPGRIRLIASANQNA